MLCSNVKKNVMTGDPPKKNGERINIVMLTMNVYFMYLSVASLFVIPGSEDNSDIWYNK